jgi:hypothetical protein
MRCSKKNIVNSDASQEEPLAEAVSCNRLMAGLSAGSGSGPAD